jgi:hypothetical protein
MENLKAFEPQLKKLNGCFKLKKDFKKFKYKASHLLAKTYKTIQLSGLSNLVTLSL